MGLRSGDRVLSARLGNASRVALVYRVGNARRVGCCEPGWVLLAAGVPLVCGWVIASRVLWIVASCRAHMLDGSTCCRQAPTFPQRLPTPSRGRPRPHVPNPPHPPPPPPSPPPTRLRRTHSRSKAINSQRR